MPVKTDSSASSWQLHYTFRPPLRLGLRHFHYLTTPTTLHHEPKSLRYIPRIFPEFLEMLWTKGRQEVRARRDWAERRGTTFPPPADDYQLDRQPPVAKVSHVSEF